MAVDYRVAQKIVSFLFAVILSSCVPQSDPAHNSANALDWAGTYKGTTPCADCPGIETVITLRPDMTYEIATRYLERSPEVFKSSGLFSWNEGGSVISLSDSGETRKIKVEENRIRLLDMSGNVIESGNTDMYILQKVESATLTETYWKLTELLGAPVTPSRNEAHIILKAEGNRVAGSGGCNRISGSYELGPHDRIKFSQVAMTMMACVDGMENERKFLDILEKADSFTVIGDRLVLNRARMAPVARFEAVYLR